MPREKSILRYLALAAVLHLAVGCAGLPGFDPGVGETPKQRFYEVMGSWVALKRVAVTWAESPAGQNRPEVINRLVLVDAQVQWRLNALAVALCVSGPPTESDPAPPVVEGCIPVVDPGVQFEATAQAITAATRLIRSELLRAGVEEVR